MAGGESSALEGCDTWSRRRVELPPLDQGRQFRGEALLCLALRRCAVSVVGQAVNISGQQVNLVIALQHFLRRHLALAAVANGLLQLRQAGAVDKAAWLGQVRRTHGFGAVALRTVAGHASGVERGLAGGQVGAAVGWQWQLGQVVTHIGRDVFHTVLAQYFTPCRHRRMATAHAGGLDRVGGTASARYCPPGSGSHTRPWHPSRGTPRSWRQTGDRPFSALAGLWRLLPPAWPRIWRRSARTWRRPWPFPCPTPWPRSSRLHSPAGCLSSCPGPGRGSSSRRQTAACRRTA